MAAAKQQLAMIFLKGLAPVERAYVDVILENNARGRRQICKFARRLEFLRGRRWRSPAACNRLAGNASVTLVRNTGIRNDSRRTGRYWPSTAAVRLHPWILRNSRYDVGSERRRTGPQSDDLAS